MKSEILKTHELHVGYRGKTVLRDIALELMPGEILCLIGPNGAGKSTILKSLAGELAAIRGSVFLSNADISQLKKEERAKRMSALFTERFPGELLTAQEVVEAGRYPYTGRFGIAGKRDRELIRASMENCRVWELRNQYFKTLSDGQQQRVLLARALCQEPEVLILDEPTSFLDIRYKLEFLSLLRRMCREKGIAVVLSLHEVELARKLSDKILAVKNGEVNRYGKTEKVFTEGYISELFEISPELYREFLTE